MFESGLVESKNTAIVCLKNILIYSIGCICFYFVGYDGMFFGGDGWMGSFLKIPGKFEWMYVHDFISGSRLAPGFFHMALMALSVLIVSRALGERLKLWPFLVFVIFLTGFIYPVQGSWSWGGGWLSEMGFVDRTGSTVVHSMGGWVALTAVFLLGPRRDKYGGKAYIKQYTPSSIPLATLGIFILWFGFLGLNGGFLFSEDSSGQNFFPKLAMGFLNTNMAACSGALLALFLGFLFHGKINVLLVFNGALAGLVSIAADPYSLQPFYAIVVGGVGSTLATLSVPLLDRLKLDDSTGAIPAHLVAGIWGTLAVGIWGATSFLAQLIGVVSVGVFVCGFSGLILFILKQVVGIRVSEDSEDLGQDLLELGIESDPEAYEKLGKKP